MFLCKIDQGKHNSIHTTFFFFLTDNEVDYFYSWEDKIFNGGFH